jgi:hypothetical protein
MSKSINYLDIMTLIPNRMILKGFGLTLILLLISVLFLNFSSNFDTTDEFDYMELSNEYSWNFSSGIALSQSLADPYKNLLYFTTDVFRITSVLGHSDDIEVSCKPDPCGDDVFAYAGWSEGYYKYYVHSIDIWWKTVSQNWEVRIKRTLPEGLSDKSIPSIQFELQSIFLSNISKSLIEEIALIDSLTKVENEQDFRIEMKDLINVGDLKIQVGHLYDDGTFIRLELIDNNLFINVQHYVSYYADNMQIRHKLGDKPDEYYIGTLDVFFESYTTAVNQFLEFYLNLEEQ